MGKFSPSKGKLGRYLGCFVTNEWINAWLASGTLVFILHDVHAQTKDTRDRSTVDAFTLALSVNLESDND